jgi:hypothetical protein
MDTNKLGLPTVTFALSMLVLVSDDLRTIDTRRADRR